MSRNTPRLWYPRSFDHFGQYIGAIFDFGKAITNGKSLDNTHLEIRYTSRADAYTKIGDYSNAIADLTKAIELELGSGDGRWISLRQFRMIYPDYDSISDDLLIRKLNKLFWPEFENAEMARRLNREIKDSISFLDL